MSLRSAQDPECEGKDATAGGEPPVRAIIFDYGNVISLPQPPSDVERMAFVLGLPLDRFRERYWRFRLSYDRAELNGESYWASVVDGQGVTIDRDRLARILALDGESWAHPNEKTLEWARQLKREGYGVALLSNMPLAVSDYLNRNCSWLAVFEQRIFSWAVGSAKPETRIYQCCLDALGLRPEETLLLDDRPENVNAGSELGMHSLVFDTLEHTAACAGKKFGLPVPPSS
jgi:putative hydrolase of the HAD superfamily